MRHGVTPTLEWSNFCSCFELVGAWGTPCNIAISSFQPHFAWVCAPAMAT